MIEEFEALQALSQRKTMTQAAHLLGITQSAVSKRIAQLEERLGKELLEPAGRYVVLTPYAERLLLRVNPLLVELKQTVQEESPRLSGTITLGAARAVLSSWGAQTLGKVRKRCPEISLNITVRGSPGTIDNVLSGDCVAGIIRGTGESAPDLVSEYLLDEPLAIVPSSLKPFRFPKSGKLQVISMHNYAESQRIIERKLMRLAKKWGISIEVTDRFQSSTVVTQLARAGFGHAVVPVSIARALGVSQKQLVHFPRPGLTVPASFICRPQTRERPLIKTFLEALRKSLPSI